MLCFFAQMPLDNLKHDSSEILSNIWKKIKKKIFRNVPEHYNPG